MAKVYVEPRLKGRPEGTRIDDYVVEDLADRASAGPDDLGLVARLLDDDLAVSDRGKLSPLSSTPGRRSARRSSDPGRKEAASSRWLHRHRRQRRSDAVADQAADFS